MPAHSTPQSSSSSSSATPTSVANTPTIATPTSIPSSATKTKKSSSSKSSNPVKKPKVDQNVGVNRVILEFENGFFTPNEQVLKPQFSAYFHCPPTVTIHNILMIIFVGPQKQRRKGSKSFSGTLPSWLSEPKLSFAPLNYQQKKEIEKEKVSLQPQNKESHNEQFVNVSSIEGMNPIRYAMSNQKMRFDIREMDRSKWSTSDIYSCVLKDLKVNPKIKVPENYSGGNGLSNFSGYITLVFFFEQSDPTTGTVSLREQEITFKMATRRNRGDPNVDPKDAEFKYYMCYTSGNFQKELLAGTEFETVFDEKLVFEKKVKYPKCTEKERMKRLLDIKYNFLTQDLFQQQLKAKRIRDAMYMRNRNSQQPQANVSSQVQQQHLGSPTLQSQQPRSIVMNNNIPSVVPAQPPAIQFPSEENPTITTTSVNIGNENNVESNSRFSELYDAELMNGVPGTNTNTNNADGYQTNPTVNSTSSNSLSISNSANGNVNSAVNNNSLNLNQNPMGSGSGETPIFRSSTFPASFNVLQEIQFMLSHYYHNQSALNESQTSLTDLQGIFQQILYIISTYNSNLDPLPPHDQKKVLTIQSLAQATLNKQPPTTFEGYIESLHEIQTILYTPSPAPAESELENQSSTLSKPKSKSKPKSHSQNSTGNPTSLGGAIGSPSMMMPQSAASTTSSCVPPMMPPYLYGPPHPSYNYNYMMPPIPMPPMPAWSASPTGTSMTFSSPATIEPSLFDISQPQQQDINAPAAIQDENFTGNNNNSSNSVNSYGESRISMNTAESNQNYFSYPQEKPAAQFNAANEMKLEPTAPTVEPTTKTNSATSNGYGSAPNPFYHEQSQKQTGPQFNPSFYGISGQTAQNPAPSYPTPGYGSATATTSSNTGYGGIQTSSAPSYFSSLAAFPTQAQSQIRPNNVANNTNTIVSVKQEPGTTGSNNNTQTSNSAPLPSPTPLSAPPSSTSPSWASWNADYYSRTPYGGYSMPGYGMYPPAPVPNSPNVANAAVAPSSAPPVMQRPQQTAPSYGYTNPYPYPYSQTAYGAAPYPQTTNNSFQPQQQTPQQQQQRALPTSTAPATNTAAATTQNSQTNQPNQQIQYPPAAGGYGYNPYYNPYYYPAAQRYPDYNQYPQQQQHGTISYPQAQYPQQQQQTTLNSNATPQNSSNSNPITNNSQNLTFNLSSYPEFSNGNTQNQNQNQNSTGTLSAAEEASEGMSEKRIVFE